MTHRDKQYESSAKIAGISWALFFILIIIWLVMLAGCSQISEPESLDITGRYQDLDNSMILLLEHNYRNVTATLEWEGISTNLSGKFDEINSQIIMSGLYYGSYQISFNLFYKDGFLAGGFVFANSGTQAVRFEFKNRLSKHSQGGLQ